MGGSIILLLISLQSNINLVVELSDLRTLKAKLERMGGDLRGMGQTIVQSLRFLRSSSVKALFFARLVSVGKIKNKERNRSTSKRKEMRLENSVKKVKEILRECLRRKEKFSVEVEIFFRGEDRALVRDLLGSCGIDV